MKIKKLLRLMTFAFMVGLSSAFPILSRKEELTKHLTEQIEEKEEDSENDIIKDAF